MVDDPAGGVPMGEAEGSCPQGDNQPTLSGGSSTSADESKPETRTRHVGGSGGGGAGVTGGDAAPGARASGEGRSSLDVRKRASLSSDMQYGRWTKEVGSFQSRFCSVAACRCLNLF